MSTLKLLAVGGPRHGEFIGDANKPGPLYVPIMPPLPNAHEVPPFMQRYCVHGSSVRSIRDGQTHFVSAHAVADLYGLRPDEWRMAEFRGVGDRHPLSEYCLFPDSSGLYSRHTLPRLNSVATVPHIRKGVYERKAIADRGVYIYRGEE